MNKKIKIVALLPMKGVSERVKNKNLRMFNGKPLFHIVLNKLLNSKFISSIVVNTDSIDIKKNIQSNFGDKVTIFDRDSNICGHYVSMNKIIEHDIKKIDANIFLQTHCTNPLIKTETIDDAIRKMISSIKTKKIDSIFSVTKIQKRFYSEDGKPFNHDSKMLVTQHLKPLYEENSCIYLFTKESFRKKNNRIGQNPLMYEIDKLEAIDIDDPEDFIIAEALYKLNF